MFLHLTIPAKPSGGAGPSEEFGRQFPVCTVLSAVFYLHCAKGTVLWALCYVHCAMSSFQCAMFSVQCAGTNLQFDRCAIYTLHCPFQTNSLAAAVVFAANPLQLCFENSTQKQLREGAASPSKQRHREKFK